MSLTSVLATNRSELGVISLGALAGAPSTVSVMWAGPFSPGELMENGQLIDVVPGVVYQVPPNVASSMYLSDPTWWVFP